MEQPDWRDLELIRLRQQVADLRDENTKQRLVMQDLRRLNRTYECWLSPHIDIEKWRDHERPDPQSNRNRR